MRIISYNIRWLGSLEKERYLRDIVPNEEIYMMCIRETKMTNITNEKCYTISKDMKI